MKTFEEIAYREWIIEGEERGRSDPPHDYAIACMKEHQGQVLEWMIEWLGKRNGPIYPALSLVEDFARDFKIPGAITYTLGDSKEKKNL